MCILCCLMLCVFAASPPCCPAHINQAQLHKPIWSFTSKSKPAHQPSQFSLATQEISKYNPSQLIISKINTLCDFTGKIFKMFLRKLVFILETVYFFKHYTFSIYKHTCVCTYVYVHIKEMLSFQKCSGLQVSFKDTAKTWDKSKDFEIFCKD